MEHDSKPSRREIRQRQILTATLRLLRRHGAAISTAQIAAEARCSKETLYNWFDDRDGIITALIHEQAQGMNKALQTAFGRAQGSFDERLGAYALSLLDIMTGDAVIAVNRVAMAQACAETSDLGAAVLNHWQEQVRLPFYALFEEGHEAGLVDISSPDDAFDMLIGLLVGDRQRKLLLGAGARPHADAMQKIAARAVEHWLRLHRPG